ncbi:MAG: carboxypeptidase regulatory-like domain-containing protein [Candidatus Cloacimonadota bacterium]|nr:carboxypeptidase regulatory-like domain-containing protein [Candidatus Cloacimonadota bacterium]
MNIRIIFVFIAIVLLSTTIFGQTSGGPDYFGYRWKNSNDVDGPEYDWVYPTAAAGSYNDLMDDDHYAVDMGFSFPFYMHEYQTLYVSSNGFVAFGGQGLNEYESAMCPHWDSPNGIIAWFWHDLNCNQDLYPNTNLFFENTTVNEQNVFVVTFMGFTEYGVGSQQPDNSLDAQIIFYEDGDFTIQYASFGEFQSITASNPISIGIENSSGSGGMNVFYVESEEVQIGTPPEPQMAIHFSKPLQNDLMSWSISGTTTPGLNVETIYTVNVHNIGFNTQEDYLVKLFKEDGTELDSVVGVEIEHPNDANFELSYTPTTIEEVAIYGQVFLADDEDNTNDSTSLLSLSVIASGSIDGNVTNSEGQPVEGATVHILGTSIEQQTDVFGDYLLEFVPVGTQHVVCEKFGYSTDENSSVTVVANQTETVDFLIDELELITISGTFVAEQDNEVPVDELNISLTGYNDYSVISNDNGEFEITGVFSDHNYTLTAQREYFNDYFLQVNVIQDNIELGVLHIQAITPAPWGVSASLVENDSSQVELSWNPADSVASFQYYKIFRFPVTDYGFPENWELISENITDTTYVDTEWYTVPQDAYIWAVQGVYVLDLLSNVSASASVYQAFTHEVRVATLTPNGQALPGFNVLIAEVNGDPNLVFEGITEQNGQCLINNVFNGTYNIEVSHPDYDTSTIDSVLIVDDEYFPFYYEANAIGDDDISVFTTTLVGNYPNPFNPTTTINFTLASEADVKLYIYNVLGQKVRQFDKKMLIAGHHSIVWNGTNQQNKQVGSGIYFYRLEAGKFIQTKKMIMIK